MRFSCKKEKEKEKKAQTTPRIRVRIFFSLPFQSTVAKPLTPESASKLITPPVRGGKRGETEEEWETVVHFHSNSTTKRNILRGKKRGDSLPRMRRPPTFVLVCADFLKRSETEEANESAGCLGSAARHLKKNPVVCVCVCVRVYGREGAAWFPLLSLSSDCQEPQTRRITCLSVMYTGEGLNAVPWTAPLPPSASVGGHPRQVWGRRGSWNCCD